MPICTYESDQNECFCIPRKARKHKNSDCYAPPPENLDCKCPPNGKFDDSQVPPPPPEGGEEEWDLQFCRWWGWNWVRRRPDEMGNNIRYSSGDQNHQAFPYRYSCPCPYRESKCKCKQLCQKMCSLMSRGKKKCSCGGQCVYYYPPHSAECPMAGGGHGHGAVRPQRKYYRDDQRRYRARDDHRHYQGSPKRGGVTRYCRCEPRDHHQRRRMADCSETSSLDNSSSNKSDSLQEDGFDCVSVRLHEKNKRPRHFVCYPSTGDLPAAKNKQNGSAIASQSSKEVNPKGSNDTGGENKVAANTHVYNCHDMNYLYGTYLQSVNKFGLPTNKNFSKFGKPYKTFSWLDKELSFGNHLFKDQFRSPLTGKTYSLNLMKINSEVKTGKLPDPIDPVKDNKVFEVEDHYTTSFRNNSVLYENIFNTIISPSNRENLHFSEHVFAGPQKDTDDDIFHKCELNNEVSFSVENNDLLHDVKVNLNRVDLLMKQLLEDGVGTGSKHKVKQEYDDALMAPMEETISKQRLARKKSSHESFEITTSFSDIKKCPFMDNTMSSKLLRNLKMDDAVLSFSTSSSKTSLKPCKRCLSVESVEVEAKKCKYVSPNKNEVQMSEVFQKIYDFLNENDNTKSNFAVKIKSVDPLRADSVDSQNLSPMPSTIKGNEHPIRTKSEVHQVLSFKQNRCQEYVNTSAAPKQTREAIDCIANEIICKHSIHSATTCDKNDTNEESPHTNTTSENALEKTDFKNGTALLNRPSLIPVRKIKQ